MVKKRTMHTLFHCSFDLKVHLVLVTKYRRRCINKPILSSLESHFGRLIKQWECELLDFNGEADHVHMLVSLNPKVEPSKLVNNLKTVTSRLIRKEFKDQVDRFYRDAVFWSRSYCIISVGGAPLEVLRQYIENQAEVE